MSNRLNIADHVQFTPPSPLEDRTGAGFLRLKSAV
jgi:hypothetical protein